MKIKNNSIQFFKKGSMMVEVLVVASIIVASVLAAMTVAQKTIYLSRQSLHQSQAVFLLEEGAEATRIIRDSSWNNISDLELDPQVYYLYFIDGAWSLSTTPSEIGIFTRKILFSSAYRDGDQNLASSGTQDFQTALVNITVSWTEGGQNISKTLQFYLADIFS